MVTDLITDEIRPADLKLGMSIIILGKVLQVEEYSNLVRVLVDHFGTIEAEWISFPKFQNLVIQKQLVYERLDNF